MRDAMPDERRLLAKFKTRCSCGEWVLAGAPILWDVQTRLTVGCSACKGRGAPDVVTDESWDEVFPVFHE